MRSRRSWSVGCAAVVIGAAAIVATGRGSSAQQPRGYTPPNYYQYVGVQGTLARVNTLDGEVEVLVLPDEPRASIASSEDRTWSWRRVRVKPDGRAVRPDRPSALGQDGDGGGGR